MPPPRPVVGFRLRLEVLGERVVPDATPIGLGKPVVTDAPAVIAPNAPLADVPAAAPAPGRTAAPTGVPVSSVAQLRLQATPDVFVRGDTDLTVLAADAGGRPAQDYVGTVALTSTDPGAALPASYTFTAADRGRHTFRLTLAAAGSQTLTATDTLVAALTGSTTVAVRPAPVATHFSVTAERGAASGVAGRILVAALDAADRVVQSYADTVKFASSDARATLPGDYTFTAADRGVHVFSVTLAAVGAQTLKVVAADNAAVTGTLAVAVAPAPVATHFALVTSRVAGVGSEIQVTVAALDANNQVVANYVGTVTFTSSDPAATLPQKVTFSAADRGVKVVPVTFATAGNQTLTAADDALGTFTGQATVAVGTPGGVRVGATRGR